MAENASLEQILELARARFAHAEVFEETGESLSVSYEDNRLKEITAHQSRGVGLRVIHEGRIGFAATTDLRDPARLVEMAETSVRFGDEAKFDLPGASDATPPEAWDDDIPAVTPEQMVAMGRAGLEMSRAANPEYLFGGGVSRSIHSQRLLNSAGLDHESKSTHMSVGAYIQEVNDNGMLGVFESKGWGRRIDGLVDLTRMALDKAAQSARIVKVQREAIPVLFTAKALGSLLGPLGIALNGKHVLKGSSVLRGREGEQILDPRISIVDDPTVPFAPSACALDDEGTPATRRALFDCGVLGGFITDRQTAGLLGWAPSGNGFRSYASRPGPSTTNTIIAAGDTPQAEIIAGLKRGLIVDQVLGGGQGNVLAGEFSVNVDLAWLVEDGQIVGRVKDCMVAGNVYELLKDNVEAISSDRRWCGGSHRPAVLLGGITLAV